MKTPNNESLRGTGRKSPGIIYKILRTFIEVRPSETLTALLLSSNIFLLLTAYYIIKPVRDALILVGTGPVFTSCIRGTQAILFIFVIKIFSSIASKVPRQKLIAWITAFFISNLVIFYVISIFGIQLKIMGIIFFIWAGAYLT